MGELTDQQLGRIIAKGSVVGVIGFYAATVAMVLLAGVSLGEAAAIAAVPTFFGGWYWGSLAYLLWTAHQAESAAKTTKRDPSPSQERPPVRHDEGRARAA